MIIPNLYIRCILTTIIDMLSPTSYLLFPSDRELVDNTSSLVLVTAIIFDFIVIQDHVRTLKEIVRRRQRDGWTEERRAPRGETGVGNGRKEIRQAPFNWCGCDRWWMWR